MAAASGSGSAASPRDPYVLVCATTADTEELARDLCERLSSCGVQVFSPRYSIRWGDSIVDTTAKALKRCTHGVVLVSHAFLNENRITGANFQLASALLQRAQTTSESNLVLLPLLLDDVTSTEVAELFPLLSFWRSLPFENLDQSVVELIKAIQQPQSSKAADTESQAFTASSILATQLAIQRSSATLTPEAEALPSTAQEYDAILIACNDDHSFASSLSDAFSQRILLLYREFSVSNSVYSDAFLEDRTKPVIIIISDSFFDSFEEKKKFHSVVLDSLRCTTVIPLIKKNSQNLHEKLCCNTLSLLCLSQPVYHQDDFSSTASLLQHKLEKQSNKDSESAILTVDRTKFLVKGIKNIFKGTLRFGTFFMPVAVKREFKGPESKREIQALRNLHKTTAAGCENLVKLHHAEEDDALVSMALDLCAGNLFDYVETKAAGQSLDCFGQISELQILRNVAEGLKFLHFNELTIVHHDLKPTNVLIWVSERKSQAKISDFGLSKIFDKGRREATRSHSSGTTGWRAPELHREKKLTPAADIFSFGCLAYYLLTKGCHPFFHQGALPCDDEGSEAQTNIKKWEGLGFCALEDMIKKSMHMQENEDAVKRIGNPAAALSLIQGLLKKEHSDRLRACCVVNHCYFWDSAKQTSFFRTFGDKDYIRKPWKTANEVKRNEKCEILLKQLKEAEEIPVVSIQWSETLRALGMKNSALKEAKKRNGISEKDEKTAKKDETKFQGLENVAPQRLLRFLADLIRHQENDSYKAFYESSEKFATKMICGFPRLLPFCWKMYKWLKEQMEDVDKAYFCDHQP